MSTTHRLATAKWIAGAAGVAGACYLANAGWSWLRYGVVAPPPGAADADPLLDAFMPDYDIVERHHAVIDAPAAVAFDAARNIDMTDAPIPRALFKARELIMRSTPDAAERPRPLVEFARSIGWEQLAEVPGRELVFGAVTQPWESDVTFRGIAAPFFAGFDEPGYVKIVWTIRVDPDGGDRCVFRTETRATATDPFARARFRRYWSLLSPGIRLIRRSMTAAVKREAERGAQACARPAASA